ncbi:MAG: YceI family protein [Algicola sp.]|nr:YceI family protein [Algicola sp.]
MKYFIYILVCCSLSSFSQDKYITRTGIITFEASVPSFEEVAAKNKSVSAILNTENGEFAALALTTAFRFKNALMEEHFNENYAESDKYPKASFKGKFIAFDSHNLSNEYQLKGTLNFHGKTKDMDTIAVNLVTTNEHMTMNGTFKVEASDFDIAIPKIVRNKIAETITISFTFDLHKK